MRQPVRSVNVRSKPLLAVRYENQVYTTIWSEQLSREERELKYTGGCFPRRAGERSHVLSAELHL
jgi:hypothetical protein